MGPLLVFAILFACYDAATIYVNPQGSNSTNCGAQLETGCVSLKLALGVAQDNDEVVLPPSTTLLGSQGNEGLTISQRGLTISGGQDTEIQAEFASSIFSYSIAEVSSQPTFKSITFLDGGVILGEGAAVFLNCAFKGGVYFTGISYQGKPAGTNPNINGLDVQGTQFELAGIHVADGGVVRLTEVTFLDLLSPALTVKGAVNIFGKQVSHLNSQTFLSYEGQDKGMIQFSDSTFSGDVDGLLFLVAGASSVELSTCIFRSSIATLKFQKTVVDILHSNFSASKDTPFLDLSDHVTGTLTNCSFKDLTGAPCIQTSVNSAIIVKDCSFDGISNTAGGSMVNVVSSASFTIQGNTVAKSMSEPMVKCDGGVIDASSFWSDKVACDDQCQWSYCKTSGGIHGYGIALLVFGILGGIVIVAVLVRWWWVSGRKQKRRLEYQNIQTDALDDL